MYETLLCNTNKRRIFHKYSKIPKILHFLVLYHILRNIVCVLKPSELTYLNSILDIIDIQVVSCVSH